MSSVNQDNFTFPFISFPCLIALGKTSNNVLNRTVETKHPFLVLKGKPCTLFTIDYDVSYQLFICGFYYVEMVSSVSTLRVFNPERVLLLDLVMFIFPQL